MWQMLSTGTCKVSAGINLNMGWENEWDPDAKCPSVHPTDTEPGRVSTAQLSWMPRDLHLPSCPSHPAVNTPQLMEQQQQQQQRPCTARQPWDLHLSRASPNHAQTNCRELHTRLFIRGTSPFTLQRQNPTHSWGKNKSSVPRLSIYNGSSFSAGAFAPSPDTHQGSFSFFIFFSFRTHKAPEPARSPDKTLLRSCDRHSLRDFNLFPLTIQHTSLPTPREPPEAFASLCKPWLCRHSYFQLAHNKHYKSIATAPENSKGWEFKIHIYYLFHSVFSSNDHHFCPYSNGFSVSRSAFNQLFMQLWENNLPVHI